MSIDGNTKLIRAFVHLANGFDARKWQERWAAELIIGINERMPYGYFRAADDCCVIVYSEDKKENWLEWVFRSWMTFIVGVDIIHAWRNRKGIYDSDVVWTHTEIQYLAVLLMFRILFWIPRPKLIAQSVWLFDRWHDFSLARRWILSRLIMEILNISSNDRLFEALDWADIVVVALKPNLHASGITNPSEIQKAIVKLSGDDNMRWGLAARAQARMKTGGLDSRSYARRHAELSRELLAREPVRAAASRNRNLWFRWRGQ